MKGMLAHQVFGGGISRHGAHCSCSYCRTPDVKPEPAPARHDVNCSCSHCGPAVAPIERLTIDLPDVPDVVSDDVSTVIESHDYVITDKFGEPLTEKQLRKLYLQIGQSCAAALAANGTVQS